MKEIDISEVLEKLKEPFRLDEIEFRVGSTNKDKTKGLALAYVTNRAIMNRLDEVVGASQWKNEFHSLDGKTKICGISILVNGEWITKFDGAGDTDFEGSKGGLSQAMKRAAVQWGIGRYLYKLPAQWVKIKPQGKSYVIDEAVKLPNWALPKDKQKEIDFKKEIIKEELPEHISKCIKAFENIGISRAELENYLHLEAEMFEKQDIETLKTVYYQITHGFKQKEDFFFEEKKKRQTDKLELALS